MIIVCSVLADVAFVWTLNSSAKTNAFARGKESLFGAVITRVEYLLLCSGNKLENVSEDLYLVGRDSTIIEA